LFTLAPVYSYTLNQYITSLSVKEAWGPTYFLEVFFGFGARRTNFESLLLILAALFLWKRFFFAALSVREIAAFTFFAVGVAFAFLKAIANLAFNRLFTTCFCLELLRALLAVFVTGIVKNLYTHYTMHDTLGNEILGRYNSGEL